MNTVDWGLKAQGNTVKVQIVLWQSCFGLEGQELGP